MTIKRLFRWKLRGSTLLALATKDITHRIKNKDKLLHINQ